MSGIADIRKSRGVPAKRGRRVVYTGSADGSPRHGTITGASHGYVRIRLDGDTHSGLYHPTWKLRYLENE